ncbi:MAG: hypothetical protein LBO03_03060 [Acidaminococcales bacterium]|jgi:hypothetical protein|nr:hypothetical protein [Acidaminococcales bacterium]
MPNAAQNDRRYLRCRFQRRNFGRRIINADGWAKSGRHCFPGEVILVIGLNKVPADVKSEPETLAHYCLPHGTAEGVISFQSVRQNRHPRKSCAHLQRIAVAYGGQAMYILSLWVKVMAAE